MFSTKPADGHPQQFVAGCVGRALHDNLELLGSPRGAQDAQLTQPERARGEVGHDQLFAHRQCLDACG